MRKPIIAFDVDGTLIDYDDTPRDSVVNLYYAFQDLGFEMWIWSGGGRDYAQRWADRLQLHPDRVFAKDRNLKPDVAVDDQKGADLGVMNTFIVNSLLPHAVVEDK